MAPHPAGVGVELDRGPGRETALRTEGMSKLDVEFTDEELACAVVLASMEKFEDPWADA